MLAVIFKGEGRFSIEERDIPKIKRDDDVILKVRCAGICGTDRHILSIPPGHPATPGIVLGHEYVGEVVDAGDGVDLEKGALVVVDPNLTCGVCFYCQKGLPNMCLRMTTLGIFMDGGFAGYSICPAKALYPVPSNLSPEVAVFAEPLSCVVNGLNKLKPLPGETCLVIGGGPMGNYFIQLLSKTGVRVLVSEIDAKRRELSLKAGATSVLNPEEENLSNFVRSFAPYGVDMVVEATGLCLDDCLKATRRGGRVLLLGMKEGYMKGVEQYDIVRNEIQIFGTYISNHSFPRTIEILSRGLIDTSLLVTHRLRIHEFGDGIEAMERGEAIKVLLIP